MHCRMHVDKKKVVTQEKERVEIQRKRTSALQMAKAMKKCSTSVRMAIIKNYK